MRVSSSTGIASQHEAGQLGRAESAHTGGAGPFDLDPPMLLPTLRPSCNKRGMRAGGAIHFQKSPGPSFSIRKSVARTAILDLPRFRGEMRAWDQALWLYVMLSSGSWHSLVRPPAEPFFRPDPCTDAAAARSGGQGRPLSAAARRACP